MKTVPNWWQTQFKRGYYLTYQAEVPPERTLKEVSFLIKSIPLTPKLKILDLACGYGRHAHELARRGYQVTGLDYAKNYLNTARKNARRAKLSIDYRWGDMRQLSFKQELDVVLLLFTSFGYFGNQENQKVLYQIRQVLKNNGKFLLDVINAEAFFTDIQKEGKKIGKNIYQRDVTRQIGEFRLKDRDTLDLDKQLVHLRRRWNNNQEKGEYHYYIHHYTLTQYRQLLSHLGFRVLSVWGDYQGSPWFATSWRTIILAQKSEPFWKRLSNFFRHE